jgi:hypothetical protein
VGEYKHIFTPITIGRLTVNNRIEKAPGVRPRTDIVKALLGLAPEVYVVGDSSNERGNLYSATAEGFFAAMEI